MFILLIKMICLFVCLRRIEEKEYEYEERWDSKEIIDKKNKGKKVEDME